MTIDRDLTGRSARELARLMRIRERSPVEVIDAHLHAIERFNPAINAVVTIAADSARATARQIERAILRGEDVGPLGGVPVGIKDVTPTAGIRTTWGSTLYADHVPTVDAEVVTRLKRAGAVVVGKTNTPEFAAGANTVNRVFGATRNPWDRALSASGSTGGGAAALSAGMIALASGTDFGGSLRTPASFCGVVGLRPTPGLIASHPTVLPWHEQSVDGPMARGVADVAAMMDAMLGYTRSSPISRQRPWASLLESVTTCEDGKGLRVAYCPDIARIGVDPEVEKVCRNAALALARDGAQVDEIDFDGSYARDAFTTLRAVAMVGTHHERLDKLERLNDNLAGNIRKGLTVTSVEVAAAEAQRAKLWRQFCALFETYDLLLTPTTPVLPFPVEQNYPHEIAGVPLASYIDWIAPTFLVSLCTLPAASVPAGNAANGLPIGLQIIGPQFSEPHILGCATLVERANPIGRPRLT